MAIEFDRIKGIIVEKLGCDEALVKPTATFADLGADSLDSVELIMSFEEEFGVELSDEEVEKIEKISDVITLIEKKIG